MKKEHPLIIVFYLDRAMMSDRKIITPFVESVNHILAQKDANTIAFFIPTEGEERVECINPSIIAEADMDKISKMVDDIAKQFSIGEPDEIAPKTCKCEDGEKCNCGEAKTETTWGEMSWDYLGWNKLSGSSAYSSFTQPDWNQTLVTKMNEASARIYQRYTSRRAGNIAECNKYVFNIIKKFEYYYAADQTIGSRFTVKVNNDISDKAVHIYDSNFPDDKIVIMVENYVSVNPITGDINLEYHPDTNE